MIDGVTRENNGFYVLLKSKGKSMDSKEEEEKFTAKPLIAGKINYDQYEIVGQSYAWLSQQGNLVFDSWENKSPIRDDKIIIPFLEKFSHAVTEQKDSTITRVMIGTGGKTPDLLKVNVASYAEIMAEGTQYGDSARQSTIFCNKTLRDSFINELETETRKLLTSIDIKDDEKENLISWMIQTCYSPSKAKLIKSILTTDNIKLIFELNNDLKVSFDTILLLANSNMLTREIVQLARQARSEEFSHALVQIKNAGVDIDIKICKSLSVSSKPIIKAQSIIHALHCIELLNEQDLDKEGLIKLNLSKENGLDELDKSIILLKEANLLNDTNILKRFAFPDPPYKNVDRTKEIIRAFTILKDAKLDQVPKIRQLILFPIYPGEEERAKEIVLAWKNLKENPLVKEAKLDDNIEFLNFLYLFTTFVA